MALVLPENMRPGLSMILDSAVWYQVFFADIFRNNCLNIGVLPVQVSPKFLQQVFLAIESDPKSTFTINLPQQKIIIDSTAASETFDINPYKKDNMINGFDDIDYLLNIKKDIKNFAQDTPI